MKHDIDVDVLDVDGTITTLSGETGIGNVLTSMGSFSLQRRATYRHHKPKNRPLLTLQDLEELPTPQPPTDDQKLRLLVWRDRYMPVEHPDAMPADARLATQAEARTQRQIHGQRVMAGATDGYESFQTRNDRQLATVVIVSVVILMVIFGVALAWAQFVR